MTGQISIKTQDKNVTIQGTANVRQLGVDTILHLTDDVASTVLKFQKPISRTEVSATGSIVNSPGSDGLFEYVTTGLFFEDEAGEWKVQAKFNMNDGRELHSQVKTFEVGETLGSD